MTPDRSGDNNSQLPYRIESARRGEKVEVFTLEVESVKAVMAWFDEERHIFGAYWPDLSQSPTDFFANAQALVDGLAQLPEIPAGKDHSGFIVYAFEGDGAERTEPRRLDMESFSPIEGWDKQKVVFARFNTPFADFSVEEGGLNGSQVGAFLTHVGKTEEFAKFIMSNSGSPVTMQAVKQLLDKAAEPAQTSLFQLTQ